jgi:hypothetical protein
MDGREELWARKASRAREDGEEEVEDLASPATTAADDDDGRCGLKWEETDGFAAARTAFIFVAASVPALRHVDERSRREEAGSAISLGKRESNRGEFCSSDRVEKKICEAQSLGFLSRLAVHFPRRNSDALFCFRDYFSGGGAAALALRPPPSRRHTA